MCTSNKTLLSTNCNHLYFNKIYAVFWILRSGFFTYMGSNWPQWYRVREESELVTSALWMFDLSHVFWFIWYLLSRFLCFLYLCMCIEDFFVYIVGWLLASLLIQLPLLSIKKEFFVSNILTVCFLVYIALVCFDVKLRQNERCALSSKFLWFSSACSKHFLCSKEVQINRKNLVVAGYNWELNCILAVRYLQLYIHFF